MGDEIRIAYSFRFKDGSAKVFSLHLDRASLAMTNARKGIPPSWTRLGNNQCSICPLKESSVPNCPIAVNLSSIAEEFKDIYAYEKVTMSVATEERLYMKDTTIQEGLGALIGIVMTTSGCPRMEYLKPMVRFHLPFASLQETIFRVSAMYLISQYFRKNRGKETDWSLAGLERIYADVGQVNRDFAERLRAAATKDANMNALVNLDCFATMVPLSIEETLAEIEPYFAAYMDK